MLEGIIKRESTLTFLHHPLLSACYGAATELRTSYVRPRFTLSMRLQGKYRSPFCTDKETRALRNFLRASQFKGGTARVQAWLTTRIAMASNQYFILREFTTQNSWDELAGKETMSSFFFRLEQIHGKDA